jgi:hypothetical protein
LMEIVEEQFLSEIFYCISKTVQVRGKAFQLEQIPKVENRRDYCEFGEEEFPFSFRICPFHQFHLTAVHFHNFSKSINVKTLPKTLYGKVQSEFLKRPSSRRRAR